MDDLTAKHINIAFYHAYRLKAEKGWGVLFLRCMRYMTAPLFVSYYCTLSLVSNFRALYKLVRQDRTLSRSRLYIHYYPQSAINSFFYLSLDQNLAKYGRKGHTPHVGNGISNAAWFFQTLFSLRACSKHGVFWITLSMLMWLFSHLVWTVHYPAQNVLIIILLLFASSVFYWNLFISQNYNVLGWALFPIGLFCMMQDYWVAAAVIWLAITYCSFTVALLCGWLVLFFLLRNPEPGAFLSFVPAGLKLVSHIRFMFKEKSTLPENLAGMLKLIGAVKSDVRYRYTSAGKFSIRNVYLIALSSQYLFVLYFSNGSLSIVFLSGIVVYVLNARFFRFADDQIVIMYLISVATVECIVAFDFMVVLSYWLLICPLPIGFGAARNFLGDKIRLATPINMAPITESLDTFLKKVPTKNKVLFAFESPKDEHEKVFGKQRALYESLLYSATKAEISLMPDWWCVSKYNYTGAPDWWGRTVDEVKHNMALWQAQYVIVFVQDDESFSIIEWEGEGFNLIASYDWSENAYGLSDCFEFKRLVWHLLKRSE